MKTKHLVLPISTDDGVFLAAYSETGLAGLHFPRAKSPPTVTDAPARVARWHEQTTRAVRAALAGKAAGKLPPLDLVGGTDFQRRIWAELQAIPAGRTVTYGELARNVGKPRAARAAGSACGANRIPVLIPCHRVLGAGGALGGFTSGLPWKRKLLAREGVAV